MKAKLYYKLSFELNYNVLTRILRIKDICESDHSMTESGTLPYGCQPQK
jgi:hypothetical protein